ncbi:transposase, partial [Streptosporangium sp. NPDC087985]|uniref:transposase n=1 Tax=Streptosporangium sp. NPDC087985 TaxID=3366196 RepID=UPI00380BCC7F
ALAERGLSYVVQVKGAVTAHGAHEVPETIPYRGRGRPSTPWRYRTKPVSLRDHVLSAGRAAAVTLTWRGGSKGSLTSQFVIVPVRVAGRKPRLAGDGSLPVSQLIAQWPHDESEPIKYWLSNLPADTAPAELVTLAKIRWRIEHDYGLGEHRYSGWR